MKVFLIILAVLVVIIAVILSLTAEFTVIFDNGWTTKIKVLWIEKDIELSKLLSFILLPEKAAEEAAEEIAEEKKEEELEKAEPEKVREKPAEEKKEVVIPEPDSENHLSDEQIQEIISELSPDSDDEEEPQSDGKPNFVKKMWDEDGVAGIMEFVTNLIETANSAITTLIKGLHIYSLYVKMIIGGGDVADIGEKFGSLAGHYYPIKGIILNQMKVDQYDDYITADFIAPRSEYEFQLIAGINVALLLRIVLRAGKVFLVNLLKNKKHK
ncbi:MAG: hypothetical protein E7571_04930 [Ruminococcaceae bacterium]|nr:hypothetical protein [Oscillospiraceae bacterium]